MTNSTTLTVTGMSCEHCVAHVTRALKEVPGVIDAKVNLDKGQAEVSYDASKASQTDLEKAVVAVGYGIARHDLPENSPGGEGGYE